MSSNSLLHRGMTDNLLSEQGLPNLTEQWVAIRHSPFAIRHSLFAIRYSLFAIRYSLSRTTER